MKQIVTLLIVLSPLFGLSQNARKLPSGDYISIEKSKDSTATGKTFTSKDGQIYPVYANVKGKMFHCSVSKKTGKTYRRYLKIEGELKD